MQDEVDDSKLSDVEGEEDDNSDESLAVQLL
jgi:hypothetical protein